MSFLKGPSSSEPPFSIDDAFDIPEDVDEEANAANPSSITPIIRNGQLRLDSHIESSNINGDGASLIQSGSGEVGGGYYEGPPPLKYWWLHPKIRSNLRIVLAALLLVVLGLGMSTV